MKEQPTTFNCTVCEDTGEVIVAGFVYANEPHTADINTMACLCLSLKEEDYED